MEFSRRNAFHKLVGNRLEEVLPQWISVWPLLQRPVSCGAFLPSAKAKQHEIALGHACLACTQNQLNVYINTSAS